MNERSGRKKGNLSNSGVWDTPSSDEWGNAAGNSDNSWDSISGNNSNVWDNSSDKRSNNWDGFVDENSCRGDESPWSSDFQSDEGDPWGNQSNDFGYSDGDIWNQPRDSKRNLSRQRNGARNFISSLDFKNKKTILIILGAVAIIGAVAYFLYANSEGISRLFDSLADAFTAAIAMGIVVVGVVYFVSRKLCVGIKGKTLLWIFVITSGVTLLKNIIPGLDSVVGAIIYAVLLIAVPVFVIKKILNK